MTLSGTVQLDPAAHAAATTALRDRLGHLDARRRRADSAIETVLAFWSGDAADAFRARWEEWSRATAGVVADLSAAAQAIDLARLDLVTADAGTGEVGERLAGRLA